MFAFFFKLMIEYTIMILCEGRHNISHLHIASVFPFKDQSPDLQLSPMNLKSIFAKLALPTHSLLVNKKLEGLEAKFKTTTQ